MPTRQKTQLIVKGTMECVNPDPKNCPHMLVAEMTAFYGDKCDPPIIKLDGKTYDGPIRLIITAKLARARRGPVK